VGDPISVDAASHSGAVYCVYVPRCKKKDRSPGAPFDAKVGKSGVDRRYSVLLRRQYCFSSLGRYGLYRVALQGGSLGDHGLCLDFAGVYRGGGCYAELFVFYERVEESQKVGTEGPGRMG